MPKANDAVKTDQSTGTVLLELPIASDMPDANWALHIDTRLTIEQSNSLRKIAEGLDRQQETLVNGRRITTATDAIKFVLEKAARG